MAETGHILLTSLGLGPVLGTLPRYRLGEREVSSGYSPLALWQLLPTERRPDRVIVLATRQAAAAGFGSFCEEADRIGVPIERCDIPDVADVTELTDFLAVAGEILPPRSRVTLDVTHGLRHHAFLFFSLAVYLTSLRNVHIDGAWYGMLESGDRDSPKPLVDLRPALDLAEWFHAVRFFRDRGGAEEVAGLVERLRKSLKTAADASGNPEDHKLASHVGKIVEQLQTLSFAYASGLPLELGRAAAAIKTMRIPEAVVAQIPMAGDLSETIQEAAEAVTFSERPPAKGEWKRSIALTDDELKRQRLLIEQYLQRDQVPMALGLMREWVVSFVTRKGDGEGRWLTRPVRQHAERRLAALGEWARKGGIEAFDGSQREWGEFWNQLADLRNAFSHQGMRPEEVRYPGMQLESLLATWNRLVEAPVPTLGGGGGVLLISPQGLNSGVLYNALLAGGADIQRCIVVCSEQSLPSLDMAAAQAGFEGERLRLVMKDPISGADEIAGLVAEAENALIEADAVVANLTGGTTMMGIAVQALVERAGRLDRPWRRFVLIDHRGPDEQRIEPWAHCGAHWLDKTDGGAHDED